MAKLTESFVKEVLRKYHKEEITFGKIDKHKRYCISDNFDKFMFYFGHWIVAMTSFFCTDMLFKFHIVSIIILIVTALCFFLVIIDIYKFWKWIRIKLSKIEKKV